MRYSSPSGVGGGSFDDRLRRIVSVSDAAELRSRTEAIQAGVRVEVLTVAWMTIEAAVAIGAVVLARSVLLTAFGFDSVIELLSGAALLWRLRVEARGEDAEQVERTERLVTKISAVLLVLLCLYVLLSSAAGFLLRVEPEGSLGGLIVAIAAVIAMPLLALRKRQVNRALDSDALRADIVETLTCAYMASATLVGVALNLLFHWWWADYLAALVLLFWLVQETREAIEAARSGRDAHHH